MWQVLQCLNHTQTYNERSLIDTGGTSTIGNHVDLTTRDNTHALFDLNFKHIHYTNSQANPEEATIVNNEITI